MQFVLPIIVFFPSLTWYVFLRNKCLVFCLSAGSTGSEPETSKTEEDLIKEGLKLAYLRHLSERLSEISSKMK